MNTRKVGVYFLAAPGVATLLATVVYDGKTVSVVSDNPDTALYVSGILCNGIGQYSGESRVTMFDGERFMDALLGPHSMSRYSFREVSRGTEQQAAPSANRHANGPGAHHSI